MSTERIMPRNPLAYYLPAAVLDNDELACLYESWSADKIYKKTGIKSRRVAACDETVSDMAVKAAENLFAEYGVDRSRVDFIILATQTPDYPLPTTACMVQDRLGIPKRCGAFDINLGCSAYVYALAAAKGLIVSNAAKTVLIVTSETYAKRVHPLDKSARTIFGDAAAAALITNETTCRIGEFVFGTDGSGYDKLIVPAGGGRLPASGETAREYNDESGNVRSKNHLFMDGAEIFNFTVEAVPRAFEEVLSANGLTADEIDLFVFHQANRFMLDYLMKILRIEPDKFYVDMEDTGNTVSSTIPIALKRAEKDGKLKAGDKVMIVGFGVGLSWAAAVINW